MTEEELKDGICEYVHNLHKVEPFNGFSYRDLRDVAEHFALPREKRIAELEKENAELKVENQKWKDEWQEQVQKATDEGYARTLQTIQLSKAKKILQKVITDFHNMDCVSVHIDKTIAEAEQFLSEVGKCGQ